MEWARLAVLANRHLVKVRLSPVSAVRWEGLIDMNTTDAGEGESKLAGNKGGRLALLIPSVRDALSNHLTFPQAELAGFEAFDEVSTRVFPSALLGAQGRDAVSWRACFWNPSPPGTSPPQVTIQ